MARYLGSINKKARKLNFSILENNKDLSGLKKEKDRNFRQRPKTEYGEQLNEKQKLRFRYFIPDKQLRGLYKRATKIEGKKDENLLTLCEMRLDNCVFRGGWATTRREARQLVSHNHVLINEKKANIPSMRVKINDVVSIKNENIKNSKKVIENFKKRKKYSFIESKEKDMSFRITKKIDLEELPNDINMRMVIEFYNRFI